jgi:hypothetical protein
MSVESLTAAKIARDAARADAASQRLKMWGALAALVAVAYFVTRKGR